MPYYLARKRHRLHALAGRIQQAVYKPVAGLGVTAWVTAEPVPFAEMPAAASFLQVDAPNVVVEAVKKSEDGDDLIVRLYEAHGESCRARVSFGFPVGDVALVDLMEENPVAVEVRDSGVSLAFVPFEILTLRVKRAEG